MRETLIRLGVSSILSGIAAVSLGFVLKSPAMHPGSADAGLRVEQPRISVFEEALPDIVRLPPPVESEPPSKDARVASLGPNVGSDALTNEEPVANEEDAVANEQELAGGHTCIGVVE